MPSTGIKPANLRSLARRSNQLSYAGAYSIYICLKGFDSFVRDITTDTIHLITPQCPTHLLPSRLKWFKALLTRQ